MVHKKKEHQGEIAEYVRFSKMIADIGMSTKEYDRLVKSQNFVAAKKMLQDKTKNLQLVGHYTFYYDELNKAQREVADRFIKEVDSL